MTSASKVVRAIFLAVIAVGTILAASRVAGQDKSTGQNVPKYDITREQTVRGVVQEVKDYHCPVSGTVGTHISIKTSQGDLEVHMAPAKFFKEYDLRISKGDDVVVTGNKVDFNGKPAIVARLVIVGHDIFAFRDETGRPSW